MIIKMKPVQKSFHMILFALNEHVVLNFKSMGEYYGGSMVVSLQSRFATSRFAAQ